MYLKEEEKIWLASDSERIYLEPSMMNRHGLIAGATGTGKTVTLKVIAESLSDMGVPVFIADVKGDLSGMCSQGEETDHIRRSIDTMGIEGFTFSSYPVRFFDVYGEQGHPVRATISDMGPELLARLLGLNDTQSGVLRIVFRIADDQKMLLLDLKDLRSMLVYVGDHASEYKLVYGNVTPQSIGAIQRALLTLEDEGGDKFFGEPMLDISDWFDWDEGGRGMMNILECQKLFTHPLLYSTFLLWMLSELYELLPEAGDLDKPKIAFFFDEAHLLFKDAPRALLEKIEQVVRLIRSKGVSVWFISQSPSDIPESVLGQIGSRVQHALRAYTPNEQKALKYAAKSFRENPAFNTEQTLQEIGVGEAIVSVLDAKGIPSMVQRANILPPRSSMKAALPYLIKQTVEKSPLGSKYDEMIDRESAYEILTARVEQARQDSERLEQEKKRAAEEAASAKTLQPAAPAKAQQAAPKPKTTTTKKTTSFFDRVMNSAASTVGREVSRELIRGILGNFKK